MNAKQLAIPVLVAILSGCASIGPIETSGDAAALPPFKTFRIHEEQFVFATELSAKQSERVSNELRHAAVSALNGRGYQESRDADVLVTLGAISRPTLNEDAQASSSGGLRAVDTSVLDAGRPIGTQGSEIMPAGTGREGDLILYLLDPKTQKVIWRASSNGAATTPSEALRSARATYAAMVAKLPRAADATAK
jgi:hypothetical protein